MLVLASFMVVIAMKWNRFDHSIISNNGVKTSESVRIDSVINPAIMSNELPEFRNFIFNLKEEKDILFDENGIWKWRVIDNRLWVVGSTDQSLYAIDDNGKVLKKWGQLGDAPWENREISSFDIKNEKFYIVDRDKSEFKIIENEKDLVLYEKPQLPFWSGTFLTENLITSVSENGKTFEFLTMDLESGKTTKIDIPSLLGYDEAYPNMNIAYEGYFVSNGQGYCAYVCLKTGTFFIIESSDKKARPYNTIDKTDPPKISVRKMGAINFFIREPDHNVNYSACIDKNNLYIISTILFERSENLALDIYNLKNGSYVGSAQIPKFNDQYPVDITKSIDGNDLYVLYENQDIKKYTMVKNE
jgi:hypothetical protein